MREDNDWGSLHRQSVKTGHLGQYVLRRWPRNVLTQSEGSSLSHKPPYSTPRKMSSSKWAEDTEKSSWDSRSDWSGAVPCYPPVKKNQRLMLFIPFQPASSPLPPNPCYICPNRSIDLTRNDWWAKTLSLTDSFFPSKETFQQEPQLRDISQKDRTYVNAHFVFLLHEDNHGGERCFPLKDRTTPSASLMQTAGFVFGWKFGIWGYKPQPAKPTACERPGFLLKITGFR